MEEALFPHANSMNDLQELEEERRLCYVAITRAKEHLYFINAKRRMIFGKDSANPPSRFIKEISKELINTHDTKPSFFGFKPKNTNSFYNQEELDYTKGDRIKHETYGFGVIISVDSNILTIAFQDGVKKIMARHKLIKKVSNDDES
jgi:DNA helicase-2/ATP-dependent DNA helicase PcrA